ncbi:biopolymer transporter ExbD [candidate division FCPU426 bacterium]|nr:biopolymer transporter ExbD [candidate division FCPU426 bacterium]
MKRERYQASIETADINISPLIDMMFLLLIFFIVTTAFVQEVGIDVQKPKAASSQMLEKQSMMLGITSKGQVVYGGKEIALGNLRGMVARQLREQERPVIVIADETCPSGILVNVIDECKLAGAKQVSIATEVK